VADTVSKLDCDITIIGIKSGDSCDLEKIPFRTKRFKMLFRKGFLFYKFFNIRLFFYLLLHKYDLLVSNDLDTLLPNFLVSKLKRNLLVYDSHEYFTGVPEIQHRPFVKLVWKSIEKIIFPHLVNIITVSDSIALQYEREYGIRPVTIRNCSRKTDGIIPYSRGKLGIDPDHFLIIMQGAGINVDRGGEELVEAVSMTENVSLLIVGSGLMLSALKNKVSELNISDRVRFVPKVPWEELIRYTKSVDVGLSLDKNTNMNYQFSLPNKLFDYMSAGIPVIASDLPEVKNILMEYNCGMIIPAVTPKIISDAITELKNNKVKLAVLKKNAREASTKINWEIESEKVKEFYSRVLHKNG